MMQGWSQEDYDERKKRQNDGLADDEDRRLIKMYEQQGFVQSRLKEWDAAGERAQAARADADARPGAGGGGPERAGGVRRPATNDDKDAWIKWADLINSTLEPDVWPLQVPKDAKKDELIAFYREFDPPVQTQA